MPLPRFSDSTGSETMRGRTTTQIGRPSNRLSPFKRPTVGCASMSPNMLWNRWRVASPSASIRMLVLSFQSRSARLHVVSKSLVSCVRLSLSRGSMRGWYAFAKFSAHVCSTCFCGGIACSRYWQVWILHVTVASALAPGDCVSLPCCLGL